MLVVTQNTEKVFLEELQKTRARNENDRCLHLRLGRRMTKAEAEDMAIVFMKMLDDRAMRAFFFDDGDIGVFSRFLTRKHIDLVSTYLAPALEPAPPQGLAFLFEISVDWMDMVKLVQAKVERKREEAQRAERERREEERLAVLYSPVSPGMVRAVAEKRRERGHVEILIADDDAFSRRLVGNVLEKNYAIHTCSDGKDAILSYVERAPDILFLDIEMPDFNGLEVLKRIFEFDPDAYVVMLSGHSNRENIVAAIDLGAKGFVGKPFSREKLSDYVGKCPFVSIKEKGRGIHALS